MSYPVTMDTANERPPLDPASWDEFRGVAHAMVDHLVDQLASVSDEPVWQPLPEQSRRRLAGPLPREGVGEERVWQLVAEHVIPYTNGNRHPRFAGWAQGSGVPLAMLADMVAAAMNAHCAGFDQSALHVEAAVLNWLKHIMGWPAEASGVLVSGGTVANLVGLTAARDAADGEIGAGGVDREQRLTFYGSCETHGWAAKSASLLGLGRSAFRSVPVDHEYRIDLDALAQIIGDDRQAGCTPFCVIGTAGTINTGAMDDLQALADYCEQERLWFHVDGAFGAWAVLSTSCRDRVTGMERADSLAFDLHKWGYLPFEIACALVRNPEHHRRAFALSGSYIDTFDRGVMAAGIPYASLGLELTRSFKALKAWMVLMAYGVDALAATIEANIQQARQLGRLLSAAPGWQLMAPVSLNVTAFRFAGDLADDEADAFNRELLLRVQESGMAMLSSTRLRGRFTLRACFCNHRTTGRDVEIILETLVRIAAEVRGTG